METQDHMSSELEDLIPAPEDLYPSLLQRVQALMFDTFLVIITAFIVFSVVDNLELGQPNIKAGIFILLFLLYDPLTVSFLGATLGHKMFNLKIRRNSDQTQKVNFFYALLRFVVKSLLGWISLLTVTGNTEKRAIHDFVSGSIVLKEAMHR